MDDLTTKAERDVAQEFDSYYSTPEASTKDYNIVRDGFGADELGSGSMFSQETKAYIESATLKGLMFSEDWVFITVDRIASKIAGVPCVVYKKETLPDGRTKCHRVDDHPLNKLLEQPNDQQSGSEFIYNVATDISIGGNAVIYDVKSQLLQIPFERVRLNFAHNGGPVVLDNYMVTTMFNDDGMPLFDKSSLYIKPEDICHVRRPNPSSMWWGLSPFVPGRRSVLFNRYSQEYLLNYYIKGAHPGMALELSGEANEKNALRLLRSFEQAYTGRRNQRRPMVLPKGVTAKPVGDSLGDQQLKDYILSNREVILALLDIPKQVVSLQEAGGLGSKEFDAAVRQFWQGTLKTTMKLIAGALNKKLGDRLGEGYYIDFDLSEIEALRPDEVALADLVTKKMSYMTLNEVRAELELPPLDGGDKAPGFAAPAPMMMAPGGVDDAQDSPQAETQDDSDEASRADQAAEETPPSDANDEGPDAKTLELRQTKQKNRSMIGSIFKAGETNGWPARRRDLLEESSNRGERKLLPVMADMFAGQAEAVAKAVRSNLKSILVMSTKADDAEKKKLKKAIRQALDSMREDYMDGYVDSLKASVELGYDAEWELRFAFDYPNEQAIEALRLRNDNKRRAMLETRSLSTFKNLNATTTDRIMTAVDDGLARGDSATLIASNIMDTVLDGDNLEGRINTIVRTETLTAASLGQAACTQDVARYVPNLKKVWITANDDRVRDTHADVEGEMVDWDNTFTNGLQFPRDPAGDPAETINCRCDAVNVPADQVDDIDWGDLTPKDPEGDR
jgi:HK97 family phage portal protein